jgi:hypothetical protein
LIPFGSRAAGVGHTSGAVGIDVAPVVDFRAIAFAGVAVVDVAPEVIATFAGLPCGKLAACSCKSAAPAFSRASLFEFGPPAMLAGVAHFFACPASIGSVSLSPLRNPLPAVSALGVCHVLTAVENSFLSGPFPALNPNGVGQFFATSHSPSNPRSFAAWLGAALAESATRAVGQFFVAPVRLSVAPG